MKSLKIAALLLCSSAFAYAQEVTVHGNTKLNTDFKKYKTYSWAKTDVTVPGESGYVIYSYEPTVSTKKVVVKERKTPSDPYVYSYTVIIPAHDPAVNTAIQNSIAQELEGRGYQNNPTSPDLLVIYRVLDQKGSIKGYVNDSPEIVSGEEVRTANDTTSYTFEPGTLLINLVDTKNSQVVWEGFASGLIKEGAFIADSAKLKEAVHLVFQEFKYRNTKVSMAK